MSGATRKANRLVAAITAALACCVLAAPGHAAGPAVSVKPLPIAAAKQLTATEDSRSTDAYFITFYEAPKLLKQKDHHYPTGAALAVDLTKSWGKFYKKAFRKKFPGKIEAGPVPSSANAKENYYYVGRSTAKVFRILTVYHFAGHTYKVGYDVNTKPKLVGAVQTYDQLLAVANGEVAGDLGANAAYKTAHIKTASAPAYWVPAYPSPRTLANDLLLPLTSWAVPLPGKDPGPERYNGGMMFLGATTASEFDGVMYFEYREHRDLRVETTRTLSGKTRFAATSLTVKF